MGALKFLNQHKGKLALAVGVAIAAYAYKTYKEYANTPMQKQALQNGYDDLRYMNTVIQSSKEKKEFYQHLTERSHNEQRKQQERAVLEDVIRQYEEHRYMPFDVPVAHHGMFPHSAYLITDSEN
jgi:hypothetical protein